jgi:type VI secretion system secreted protein VgrG
MLKEQNHVDATIKTPLGANVLILDRLQGEECASSLFCFLVDVHSIRKDIDFDSLIAQEVVVVLTYGGQQRHFTGIIGHIEQQDTLETEQNIYCKYVAKIYPPLWLLKFTQDCHIFQNQQAIDIIKKVLRSGGVTKLEDQTTVCGRTVREYCVQYDESHFDFVSRLMEEEGIFYFFKHSENGCTMVLADGATNLLQAVSTPLNVVKSAMRHSQVNTILKLYYQRQVVVKSYATADYNFKTASTKLYNTVSGEGEGGKVYRYPGIYLDSGEGDTLSTHRIQELEWYKTMIKGESTAPNMMPMFTISVADHPRDDLNRSYTLYRVVHQLAIDSATTEYVYHNEFEAFPDDIIFRPPIVTPKPIIPSTQTARVTGKSGEEIWCDEYGRIKVHFHWDQYNGYDEKSSCWIRVAQLWAGSNWGGLWTPRVGMEVVVTFLEGNPDRPLITGCVYNSDNMPPYAKDEPSKSTIKSNTTKGGGGHNEIRFEDKKMHEEIFIHAQKDMNTVVEDNRTLKINMGEDTTDIMQGNRVVTLHAESGSGDTLDGESYPKPDNRGNDTLTLAKGSRLVQLQGAGPEQGNHTLEITKGDNTITITKGNFIITLDEGSMTITVSKDITATVGGKVALTVTGDVTVTNEGNMSYETLGNMTLKAAGNISLTSGGNFSIESTGNTSIEAVGNFTAQGLQASITGETSATLEGGASATVEGGGSVTIEAGGSVAVEAASVSLG